MKMEKVNSLGWELKLVSELIEDFERGISYSSEDIVSPDGIPLMNLACVDKTGFYRPNRLKFYSGEYSDSQKIFPNDMLVACTDMTREAEIIGTPILVPEEADFLLYTMDLALLKPNEGVCPMFLYYALKTKYYRKYIKPWASGTNVLHLNLKGIYDYKLYIPKELAEQEKIGKVLANIDRKIELNKAINANLEAMAKQLYDYWFVQFDFPDANGRPYKSSGGKMLYNPKLKRDIPEGWEDKTVEEIEPYVITGKTPPTSDESNFNGSIPFITIDDIRKHLFIYGTERTLSEKGANSQSGKYLPKGSLCCSCIGTTGIIGFVGKVGQTNQQINTIVFENSMNKEFLCFSLKQYFEVAKAKVGNILPNMNKEEFLHIPILYPSVEILEEYHLAISPLFKMIDNNVVEIDRLTALRDSLLPMLMNGQVSIL